MEDNMHVGVFTYYYYPLINGVVLTIGDWKKEAKRDGIPMTVFTSQADWNKSAIPDVVEYPAIRLYKKLGITIPVFPAGTIEKEIRTRHINLLHVHHPFYIGRLALDIKKKFHLPVVFTYHTRYTDYVRTYVPFPITKFINLIVTRIVVRFMNACDAVTVANEALKDELAVKGVHTPVSIVPPGIDTQKFGTGSRGTLRKQYGIAEKDTVLLYVGRLAKEKNIYFLLRSFVFVHRQKPKTHFFLVGSGMEEKGIRAYARRKHVDRFVHILGDRTPQNIEDAYAAADVFIYASQTETFGRVLVEAMAAALPIVALNGLSISDLIADGMTGIKVYKKSPRVFASRVLEVLDDPEGAASMGNHARSYARENFDNRASWAKLKEVYAAVSDNR